MIRHRHIKVGKNLVNSPSFMVRVESEKPISLASTSPHGGAREGRTKRKKQQKGKEGMSYVLNKI